jgi:O-acetyl-ADP-ribose deacetylase (regulator of RNase III)
MTHYPAARVRELVGRDLEPLIKPHTPLAIGAAFVTDAGNMRARHLIHVANTDGPGGQVMVEDVARATAAVIVACELKGFETVAIPLMGGFESGIPAEEAARAIHSEFKSHRREQPLRAILMASSPEELEVFEMAIEGLG